MVRKILVLKSCFILWFSLIISAHITGQTNQFVPDGRKSVNPKTSEPFQMIGKFLKQSRDKNNIDFQCKNALVRLEICTEDIIRIRMSPSGKFKPNETWVVIQYDWPETNFSIEDKGVYLSVKTSRLQVKAYKSPFRIEFLDL